MAHVLSIVIPAYNEARFIGTLLERINGVDLSPFGTVTEIVVVDDCSRDATAAIAEAVVGVTVARHATNQGKGAAVRTGLARSSGDFIIIQDADLEYDPSDYVPMLRALLTGPADVVYGSRYLGTADRSWLSNLVSGKRKAQSWAAYLGGRSLSLAARAFTGARLTDTVTALKLFRRHVIASLDLVTSGFELDHEITAKVCARGFHIVEVPIHYHPRTKAEGKKIGFTDWLCAIRTFARFGRG